jgi:hypothetical protein
MQEQGVLTSGKESEFALGLMIGRYRGLRTVGHSGGDAGYRSHVLWFPEQEFGVAIASNHARFNPAGLANEVADVFLGAEFTTPKSAPVASTQREAIALDPAALDKFTGSYAFDAAPDFVLTYTREGGRFYAQATGQDRFEIFPESPAKFFYKVVDAQVTFEADADGKVNRIIHHQGGRDQKGTRAAAPEPAVPGDLAKLTGHYWSEELETRYTILVKGGTVYASHLRHGEILLTPGSRDRFRSKWWFMQNVEFLRDTQGNVTGAKLGGGRVVGVHFARQPASD